MEKAEKKIKIMHRYVLDVSCHEFPVAHEFLTRMSTKTKLYEP